MMQPKHLELVSRIVRFTGIICRRAKAVLRCFKILAIDCPDTPWTVTFKMAKEAARSAREYNWASSRGASRCIAVLLRLEVGPFGRRLSGSRAARYYVTLLHTADSQHAYGTCTRNADRALSYMQSFRPEPPRFVSSVCLPCLILRKAESSSVVDWF